MTAAVSRLDARSMFTLPSRVVTWRAARRRSYTIGLVRLALLIGMLAIAGFVVFHIVHSALNPVAEVAAPAPPQGGEVRMVNPRFTGRDGGGAPYVISANAAVRQPGAGGLTELEQPRLDFTGDTERGALIQATRGVYDRENRILDLFGDVRFVTKSGYDFRTRQARVFVDEGRVSGQEDIEGVGPLGAVKAQSFEIWNGGARVVFSGNVDARLMQAQHAAPDLRTDTGGATIEEDVN